VLIVFRIVLLIVSNATAAARVLGLLLGQFTASLRGAPLICLAALLVGIVHATALLATLLLILGLQHWEILVPGH
jgi:hypothetical protein